MKTLTGKFISFQITLSAFVLVYLQCISQRPDLKFERINFDDLHYTNCIVKDRQGFMWMGTLHGLYRYDGTHIRAFTHISNDTSTISGNAILGLCAGHNGLLWVSTNQGLNCFNPETGKFKKYFHDDANPNSLSTDYLGEITEDNYGHLWIASLNGLNEFDLKTGKFTVFKHNSKDSLSIKEGKVFLVFIDHLNRYWVATDHGLNLFNVKTGQFRHFLTESPAPWTTITNICEDESGILWLATWGEGLIKFDPNTFQYSQYWEEPEKKHRGDHNILFGVTPSEWDTNYLYVATHEKNFCLFDKRTGNFISYKFSEDDSEKLQITEALFNDHSGILWIGSHSGVYKLNINKPLFNQLNFSQYLDRDCLGFTISAYEDKLDTSGNTVWLGTWTCGLVKTNLKQSEVQIFNKGLKRKDKENYQVVTKILRDNKNTLWIGSREGIFQQDSSGNMTKKFSWNKNDSSSLSNNIINDIFQDDRNQLWIATSNGLNLYNEKNNSFTHYYPSNDIDERGYNLNKISKIVSLHPGQLAIMIDHEDIYLFDTHTKIFSRFFTTIKNPAGHKGVYYDMLTAKNGNLWCASSFGVLKFRLQAANMSMKILTTVQGLSYDYATGIAEDNCGNIWVITRDGLNEFDEQTNSFRQFFSSDGLFDNIMEGAFIKGLSGNLIIGYGFAENHGIMNYFNPCMWKFDSTPPPVLITGFKIFNHNVDSIKNISTLKKMELSYKDRMITFEFAAFNYNHSERNQYAYKLEGFDKDWVYARNNTSATYTNLDGGNYVFHVKAANNRGVWNKQGASIAIYVQPVFYETWWFYLLCAIAVAGILYLAYKARINQIKKLYAIRSGISRDLHDDIGSRLSSISIISQLADNKKEDPDFNVSKFFEQVKQGSKEAMELMNDIVWSVNPQQDKLNDMLIRMREYAADILEAKNIDFQINVAPPLQNLHLRMTMRKDFYLIYKEAINNLAKYSNCTTVHISILKEDEKLILVMEDNGKGFDINSIKKGNGLNNMQGRAAAIKGRLTIRSETDRGTSVKLEVPVA